MDKKFNRQFHLPAGANKLRFHRKTGNPLLLKISSKGFLFVKKYAAGTTF